MDTYTKAARKVRDLVEQDNPKIEAVVEALRELLKLKALKDKIQEGGPAADPNNEYATRKPFAWINAQEALDEYDREG